LKQGFKQSCSDSLPFSEPGYATRHPLRDDVVRRFRLIGLIGIGSASRDAKDGAAIRAYGLIPILLLNYLQWSMGEAIFATYRRLLFCALQQKAGRAGACRWSDTSGGRQGRAGALRIQAVLRMRLGQSSQRVIQ
jgi:hypothetical protein